MKHVWESLSQPGGEIYPDSPRPELLGLMEREPRRLLELGCHRGALGAALKARYPSLFCLGFEINEKSAAAARQRLDEVVAADFLAFDTTSHLAFAEPFDTVVLADVLEHLYDPWATLVKIRGCLAPDARIYASVPNVRNLWLIDQLVQGRWSYQREGLLDVTHIRFFTLAECGRMFAETGYRIEKVVATRDPRVGLSGQFQGVTTLMTPHLALHQVDATAAAELSALQFLFVLGV